MQLSNSSLTVLRIIGQLAVAYVNLFDFVAGETGDEGAAGVVIVLVIELRTCQATLITL